MLQIILVDVSKMCLKAIFFSHDSSVNQGDAAEDGKCLENSVPFSHELFLVMVCRPLTDKAL